jgi:hypothetical protein
MPRAAGLARSDCHRQHQHLCGLIGGEHAWIGRLFNQHRCAPGGNNLHRFQIIRGIVNPCKIEVVKTQSEDIRPHLNWRKSKEHVQRATQTCGRVRTRVGCCSTRTVSAGDAGRQRNIKIYCAVGRRGQTNLGGRSHRSHCNTNCVR